jgi:acetyl-CoA carboxylase alpha subunit
VGPEDRTHGGIGIREANAIARMVRFAVRQKARRRAPILLFVFCQGHASDLLEERAGIHLALAESMRSLVAARAAGHPTLCVLGGGVYGAAYVALAAPCHRILALRGTAVAPMAPRLLAAFRQLRGLRVDPETPADLAELLPEVRMVESVVRLPRALREELDAAREQAAAGARASG